MATAEFHNQTLTTPEDISEVLDTLDLEKKKQH